jgi:hypothetical protein
MNRFLRLVPALAFAFTVTQAHAQKQTPYAFRGLRLGIALDAFRRDQPALAIPSGSVAVCETDPQAAALGMNLGDARNVSIACKWAHRADDGWRVSQAVVDCAPSFDHVLRFSAMPGESVPRLYRMSFVFDARIAADFADALALRYGRARIRRQHGYTSRIWENDASSITLEASEGANTARVIYRLKDHEAYLARLADQWRLAAAP